MLLAVQTEVFSRCAVVLVHKYFELECPEIYFSIQCYCSLVSLASNALTAADWTVLTSLTTLSYLDLHGNRLWGTIPSSIGQLSALTYLDMSWNMLSGSVPSTLSSLTQLR